nr:MAG TPA: hypothetical protein [Caudoviricetes sp.]
MFLAVFLFFKFRYKKYKKVYLHGQIMVTRIYLYRFY